MSVAALRSQMDAIQAVRRLLTDVGEDPDREGLRETPKRYVKALMEMTSGYAEDIGLLLSARFEEDYDAMVVVTAVEFASLCEHHLLPFTGHATVGYLPKAKVVGLSKLARVVQAYSRRLQVQERLTQQVAEALQQHLDPLGVGVVVTAKHECMAIRGVKQPTARMTTSALLGAMREEPETRAEFLALARANGHG